MSQETQQELEQGSSLWKDAVKRLRKNYAAMAGAAVVGVMALSALTYEVVAVNLIGFTYTEQHPYVAPRPPGARSVPEAGYSLIPNQGDFSFEKLDRNGDGILNRRDIRDGYRLYEFQQIDTNGDGGLDYQEYVAAPLSLAPLNETVPTCAMWKRLRKKMAPIEVEEVFQCGVGENGLMPLKNAGKLVDLVGLGEARTILGRLDKDGSGAIEPGEFQGLPQPRAHMLGTDKLGRDLLSRIIYGGRISLAVGLIATLVSFLIGVTWGATAGYLGGKVDNIMMRIVDIMYGLPFMFLVILLMVVFGQNILLLFVALGAIQWLTMARIVRGQVISLKKQEFVEAAHAIGASNRSIIFTHLIPNALGPIIVYSTLTIPAVMLEEAFLSFLGLGVQAPQTSWGALASEGRQFMDSAPWLILFPGLALAITLLSMNFLGDGLRDALDPQLRKD